MNRDEYHYAHTAALCAEALLAGGKHSLRESAEIAWEIAYWDAMTDWRTPHHCKPVEEATQIRPDEAAAVIAAGGFWPIMARVHMHHFSPTGVPKYDAGTDLQSFGTKLHLYQDAGEPGCPHQGYVGYPSELNWKRTGALGRLKWWQKLGAKLRPSLKRKTWGHMLDPEADNIERCRAGALNCGVRVFEQLSGHVIFWVGTQQNIARPHWAEGKPVQALIAIQDARNDKELERMSYELFQKLTRRHLPRFRGGRRIEMYLELCKQNDK